jgi:hypothetical protein
LVKGDVTKFPKEEVYYYWYTRFIIFGKCTNPNPISLQLFTKIYKVTKRQILISFDNPLKNVELNEWIIRGMYFSIIKLNECIIMATKSILSQVNQPIWYLPLLSFSWRAPLSAVILDPGDPVLWES